MLLAGWVLQVCADCFSAIVLSATAPTTFFVFLALQFLSMLSYLLLLTRAGIALKECLGGGRKSMAARIENAAVGVFSHALTQVIAGVWYLVCAPIMRFVPWYAADRRFWVVQQYPPPPSPLN